MASGSKAKTGQQQQQQTQEQESEEKEKSKAEGLLRSRKAVLPSEVHHRERSSEDPWRGRGEEEQEMATIRNISQAMELGGQGGRERDGPVYTHKKAEDTCNQPRAAHADLGLSAYSADSGDLLSAQRNTQNQAHDFTEGQVGSRVSVAQLRHSYMEGSAPTSTTTQASRRNDL